MTTGPWGGAQAQEGERTIERPSAALLAVLAGDPDAPALPARPVDDGAAELTPVTVTSEGDALALAGPPGAPIGPGDEPASRVLDALARAARALATLHDGGRAHGDVRADTIRRAGDAVRLLTPARPVDAGGLLAARLREGAPPEAVAFAAPEVVRGERGTPASDVYALAALAYRAVAGRAPLGQLEVGIALADLGGDASAAIARALHPAPTRRPGVQELGTWLAAASRACQDIEAFSGAGAAAADRGVGATAVTGAAAARGAPRGRMVHGVDDDGRERRADEADLARPQQLSGILLLVLLLGGALVLIGAITFATFGWQSLGEAGRAGLLVLLTLSVGAGGLLSEGRYPRTGFVLLVVATQLLWSDLIYILVEVAHVRDPGPWLAGGLAISAVTWGLAVARRSPLLAALGTVDLIGAWVALGDLLSVGSDRGPIYFLLIVALGYAAVAGGAHRLLGAAGALPPALASALCAVLSALGGLVLTIDGEHELFGSVWPYGVLAAAGLAAYGLAAPYRLVAIATTMALLALVPLIESFRWYDQFLVLQVEVAIGLATLAAAFNAPRLAADASRQTLAILLGLLHLTLAPGLLCVIKCHEQDGWRLLSEALASGGHVQETRFAYLSVVCGLSAGLVALAFLFTPRAARKASYRLLEAGGLALFFVTLTLLSLARSEDFSYPALVFGGGLALIGLGMAKQRVTLVAASACALLVNAAIQYFAKLTVLGVPTSLLVIGFGLALLAGGLIYEKRVKHLLPTLWTSWA